MPISALLLLLSAATVSPDAPSMAAKGAALLHGCQAELRVIEAGPALDKTSPADLINGAYCIGYLNGFLTGIKPGPNSICVREDNMGDLVRAYVHYMSRNPQLEEEDKRVGLRLALQDTFPCPLGASTSPSSPGSPAGAVRQPGVIPGRILARSRHHA